MVIDRDDMPPDPDLDHVDEELLLLAYSGRPVTLISEDGVGPATVVIVPSLFGHAHRLREDEAD